MSTGSEVIPPPELHRYSDFRHIDSGAHGSVYTAVRDKGKRTESDLVAVKVLRSGDLAELRATKGFTDTNIIAVSDVVEAADGTLCMIMPYFPQRSLAQADQFSVGETLAAGIGIARALRYAHERDVLHCDVKPGNVLIRGDDRSRPDSYVLADFGIARHISRKGAGSANALTRGYASPQVWAGEALSAADDIWALGATLFALLEDEPPFSPPDTWSDDAAVAAYRERMRSGRPPTIKRVGVPAGLQEIIRTCLKPNADDRYENGGEVCNALDGVDIPAAPTTEPTPKRSRGRRRYGRWVVSRASIIVLSLGVLGSLGAAGIVARTELFPWWSPAANPSQDVYAPIPDRFIEVVNAHSGKCLDKFLNQNYDRAGVMQHGCWGASNQHWNLSTDRIVNLQHAQTSLALTVKDGSRDSGAEVYVWSVAPGTPGQQWSVTLTGQASNGWRYLTIKNVDSGKCLQVRDASMVDTAGITQADCNGKQEQLWRIRMV